MTARFVVASDNSGVGAAVIDDGFLVGIQSGGMTLIRFGQGRPRLLTYKHESWGDDPVLLYREIDDGRHETRKVEIFGNGKRGYASATKCAGGTTLSELPIPPCEEISSDPQFEPGEITKAEFEEAWKHRKSE